MKQLTLPYPLARDKDVITSHEAAEKMIKSGNLERQERLVLITIQDVCAVLGTREFTPKEIVRINDRFAYHTIQRRLSGLRNKGKIERISINNNGKPPWKKRDGCCVWRLL